MLLGRKGVVWVGDYEALARVNLANSMQEVQGCESEIFLLGEASL